MFISLLDQRGDGGQVVEKLCLHLLNEDDTVGFTIIIWPGTEVVRIRQIDRSL